MRHRNAELRSTQPPLIRFRSMLVGTGLLILIISGPLLVVTKQVYITDVSIRMNKVTDSLKILDKEVTSLKMTCEQLSSNERIEKFARETRHLEYPSASQIVIIKMPVHGNVNMSAGVTEVLSFLNRAIGVTD